MKPIRIVGGGLAGLALGIALRRQGVPVTLFEAGTYPRHRVCGEFISGVSEETLDALGIGDALAPAVRAETCAWFTPEGPLLERSLPRAAWSLSRFTLDQALAGRFTEAGGTLQTGMRINEETGSEGMVFTTGRKRRPSPWVGLKMHAEGLPLAADLEMHVTLSGYVGLNRLPSGRVNVCGFFLKKCVSGAGSASLAETVKSAGLETLFRRIAAAAPVPESFCAVSAFLPGWQPETEKHRLFLGDAAAAIAPFTGNGMSMAFESAALAGGLLVRYSQGEVGWTESVGTVRRRLRAAFGRRLLLSRLAHPLLRRPRLFGALARLGEKHPVLFNLAFSETRR